MGTSSRSENEARFVGHKQQHNFFTCLSISFEFNSVLRKEETHFALGNRKHLFIDV
jgi:hypothetical protein